MNKEFKTFDNFKTDFENRSQNITNIDFFIKEELNQIDKLLNHRDFQTDTSSFMSSRKMYRPKIEIFSNLYWKIRLEWEVFENAYKQYCYNEIESEFDGYVNSPTTIQAHTQGFEFAKYTLWLKRDMKNDGLNKKKKTPLSHKQKMLALHYLGLDLSKYDNTKSAKILSQILDLSEENTRKYISYLSAGKNNVRTKSNLEKLSQLFEQQNFIDVSNQINSDIKKM